MSTNSGEPRASIPRGVWAQLGDELTSYAESIRDLPVSSQATVAEVRDAIASRFDFHQPVPIDRLVPTVSQLLRDYAVHVGHPRYFGLFNPSVRPAAVVADALAAAYNPQLAAWSHAPAAAELERATLRVLGGVLGLDPDAMLATFTSGGMEANLSAVLAALAQRFPEMGDEGVGVLRERGQRPLVYVSSQSHHSFIKITRMTGLGTNALRQVPVSADGTMDARALDAMLREDRSTGGAPVLVVGTAGTTGTGAVDPLDDLAEVARRHGVWFHVDAAWGGAAAFVPRLRPLLRGMERADSITWDAHKWLSVPMGAGMFFCRHPEAVRRAFAVTATYMPPPVSDADLAAIDPFNTTAQWSRRAIGLKVFMALAELGLDGYARLIEQQTALGDEIRRGLVADEWIVVNSTMLPVVNFTNADLRAGRYTAADLLGALYARGRVWISELRMADGEPALRACVTSYRSTSEDVATLLAELAAARTVVRAALGLPGAGDLLREELDAAHR